MATRIHVRSCFDHSSYQKSNATPFAADMHALGCACLSVALPSHVLAVHCLLFSPCGLKNSGVSYSCKLRSFNPEGMMVLGLTQPQVGIPGPWGTGGSGDGVEKRSDRACGRTWGDGK